jgi:hypothetical protein
MSNHTPKKPSQEWLDHIKNRYTYDREKGQVFNNKKGKPPVALNAHGYLRYTICLNGKQRFALAHHLVWFFEYEEWPTSSLDHIDGNKVNNHHTNLRQATSRENTQFYSRSRKTASKYVGVDWVPRCKPWRARIRIEGKLKHLGIYECEIEAARAYDKALVGLGLAPVNVNIMRDEERMQEAMEFMNDTD